MKYLVVKGYLGFGDRLESLKMCVEYALKYNLQIYVDWRDSMWSHGDESFYTYFKLVNIPILESLYDIPRGSTIFPVFWKDKLHDPIDQKMLNNQKETGINLHILSSEYHADVIVYSCIGARRLYADCSFFANVFRVIHPDILSEIRHRQDTHNLSSSIGLHLRGTDRAKNTVKRDRDIQFMALNLMMRGGYNGRTYIAVSDDNESINIWKRFYPSTTVMSKLSLEHTHKDGNHNAQPDDLTIDKNSLNIDTIIDFFTLSSCESVLMTCKDSRFAKEAIRLSPYIHKILGNG